MENDFASSVTYSIILTLSEPNDMQIITQSINCHLQKAICTTKILSMNAHACMDSAVNVYCRFDAEKYIR